MPKPLIIHTLTEKRAEILVQIKAYEAQIAHAKHDLAHVNATIKLFAAPERQRDLDISDTALRNSVVFKIVQALRHAKRRKLVRMIEKKKGMCVWGADDAVTLRVVANTPSTIG
ncbi:hypothetical protein [Epibacterium ulvae]|uniref:hypothetical protein n=1 Tax=Epibacterium ulvae TaxID=1156985 RepID=UPI002492C99B|nr:hypothetical protein [Epibacterium ulvae]